jgi:hypothetical protein
MWVNKSSYKNKLGLGMSVIILCLALFTIGASAQDKPNVGEPGRASDKPNPLP